MLFRSLKLSLLYRRNGSKTSPAERQNTIFGGKIEQKRKIMKKIQKKSSKTLAFSAIIRYTVKAIEKEVQAIMAKCSCCGKGVTFGIKVSHSHRRSNRTWNPNVKRVKAIVDGSPKYIYACTRCLRSGKVTRAV